MSFDAWGKRREVTWFALTVSAIAAFDTSLTTRGFTGHEMLDGLDLVHMNGRVYDPEIGRFLSADPFVQAPDTLQSWNRYSYVLNNPLSLTDPSGFFFSSLFRSIGRFFSNLFRAIGDVVKKVLASPIFRGIIQVIACAQPFSPLTCGATVAALTLASGGSLIDALKAVAFSFAQIGVFSSVSGALNSIEGTYGIAGSLFHAAAHGVIGGAFSVAQGGSFAQGFVNSALGSLGGSLAQGLGGGKLVSTIISAAAACGGAALTGGKCAQAAVTAAFANLYNRYGSCDPQFGRCAITPFEGGGGGGMGGSGGAPISIGALVGAIWGSLSDTPPSQSNGNTDLGNKNQTDQEGNSKKPFALGIEPYLDRFAKEKGAETYKHYPSEPWQSVVMGKLYDPQTNIHVNLTDVDVWRGISDASSGRQSAIGWELLQIRNDSTTWSRITWWRNGNVISNPFK